MTTSWKILIDWDRDGEFTEIHDDVTDKVINANWYLGMREAYRIAADDSMLKFTLDNSDRRFSPENTSSPLHGGLAPFRTVKVLSDDGTTERTHWIGWIETIEPTVGQYGQRTVTITAAGPMQFYKAAETDIEIQENKLTSQIIARLLKEVTIPPALTGAWFLGVPGFSEIGESTVLATTADYSELETGRIRLAVAADNWVRRDAEARAFNVYQAIMDVTAAERGRFFFSREGKAVFWNRSHLQDKWDTAISLNDDMVDMHYAFASTQADFKNEVIVNCHPRRIGAYDADLLWQLERWIEVKPGEKRTINVRYFDGGSSDVRIGAKDVYLDKVKFSQAVANVTLEARANGAVVTLDNTGGTGKVVLEDLQVRGRRITDYGQMQAEVRDNLSIARYGRRTLKMNLSSVDNLRDAESIARYELRRRKEPRGVVSQVTLRSHGLNGGGYHDKQLELTIGDVVKISETQTGHNAKRYTIIGEAHDLSENATNYQTTWYLEPAPDEDADFPWKLGMVGRSELGQKTWAAF